MRLAVADRPAVLCLQEVPAWALSLLPEWSGMQAFGEIAQRPTLGPFPSTAALGRALTSLHHGLLRSAFAGQGNAILLAPELRPLEQHSIVLNSRSFRRRQADWLGLGIVARLAWAKERRICQTLRVVLPDERCAVVANVHTTSYAADRRLADAELLRAAVFADGLAKRDELCVLAGDFNVEGAVSQTLRELAEPEWGFSRAATGIDHVLVRGADATAAEVWEDARRRLDGRLLSDHAPVEVRLA